MTLQPLGDSAVTITFGDVIEPATVARVQNAAAEIARRPPNGVRDIVPAFASIAVFFDVSEAPTYDELCTRLQELVLQGDTKVVTQEPRLVEIPLVYGGEYGPDLADVAAHTGLTEDAIIAKHSGAHYIVNAIGFVPGFPYLSGLPPELATPRRSTPRQRIPPGSVGIGGVQSGIYPLETPGGWNVIGRTPLELFDPTRGDPALLRVGDSVRFTAIRREDVRAWPEGPRKLTSQLPLAEPRLDNPSRLQVIRAGMFTTVQDLGRTGHRASGVPVSGAADPFALRLANLLVGNPDNTAALEFTLVGPRLRFTTDVVVALTGANFGGADLWRPFRLDAGATLELDAASSGCRGYLAVAGGIAVPPTLGSASTYVRAAIGGFEGRALRDGDILPLSPCVPAIHDHWRIDDRILPDYSSEPRVRVITGRAGEGALEQICGAGTYRVTPHADRMGVRLAGTSIEVKRRDDALSEPIAPGTIQVPPDGQPIILLADAQTIGGYPQVGHVAAVDLPLVAQLRPGDRIQFVPVSLAEARALWMMRERALSLLKEGLAQKLA